MSECGKSGCKEEPLAAEEKKQVLIFDILCKWWGRWVNQNVKKGGGHYAIMITIDGTRWEQAPIFRNWIFRQLVVRSVVDWILILTPRFTSPVARTRKTWTSPWCQRRLLFRSVSWSNSSSFCFLIDHQFTFALYFQSNLQYNTYRVDKTGKQTIHWFKQQFLKVISNLGKNCDLFFSIAVLCNSVETKSQAKLTLLQTKRSLTH